MLFGIVWTGQPWQQVDCRVPFFLFTILVAVGEDYNILLMTSPLEERAGTGPARMRLALARTGGTITSCGVIMAGTFATLMLTGLNSLVQIARAGPGGAAGHVRRPAVPGAGVRAAVLEGPARGPGGGDAGGTGGLRAASGGVTSCTWRTVWSGLSSSP